jgi:hypothetical protein
MGEGKHTQISMNDPLEQETLHTPLSSWKLSPSKVHRLLYGFTWATVVAAFVAGIFLLASDVFWTSLPHAPLSAAPLLLIGGTYLGFQALIRPKLLDLLKALIVSSAFLLWGVDQILPTGWFATLLGDVVIVLYVVDLGWMIADRLKRDRKSHPATSATPEKERRVSLAKFDARTPLLRLGSSPSEEKLHATAPLTLVSHRRPSSLKRMQLAALPCTCASPLAPFRSSTCCSEMQETSGDAQGSALRTKGRFCYADGPIDSRMP